MEPRAGRGGIPAGHREHDVRPGRPSAMWLRICQNRQTAYSMSDAPPWSPDSTNQSSAARTLSWSSLDAIEPGGPVEGARTLAARGLHEGQVRACVAVPQLGELAGAVHAVQRVLPDRLEHREARVAVVVHLDPDEALLGEALEPGKDVERCRVPWERAQGLGRLQVAAAREDPQPREQAAILVVEQVVAPVDRAAQRPLPLREVRGRRRRGGRAGPRAARAIAAGESSAHAGRRELDRERQPVEAAHDLGDVRRVVVGEREVRPDGPRPLDEQLDGLGSRRSSSHGPRRPSAASARRRDRELLLAGHPERRAAGREDRDVRRRAQDLADDGCTGRPPARSCRARAARCDRAGARRCGSSGVPGRRRGRPAIRRSRTRRGPGRGPPRAATNHAPSGNAVRAVRGQREREPRLARSRRGRSGSAAASRRAASPRLASSRPAPRTSVSCAGRLFGTASSERSGGKSRWRSGRVHLEDALRAGEVLETVLAEVAERDARARVAREHRGLPRTRRPGRRGPCPRRGPPGAPRSPGSRRPRPGPRRCGGPCAPAAARAATSCRGQRALGGDGGPDRRRPRTRRRRSGRRPRCRTRRPPSARTAPQHELAPAVASSVAVREVAHRGDALRGALDVGEQERDGPGRQRLTRRAARRDAGCGGIVGLGGRHGVLAGCLRSGGRS